MVVRRHALGNIDVLQPPAVGGADQRTGDRERQPHVPGQRQDPLRGTAAELPARNVRHNGRVLEAKRFRPTEILRDTLVPATEKPRIRSGNMKTESNETKGILRQIVPSLRYSRVYETSVVFEREEK